MVTFFGFLDHLKMFFEIGFVKKRSGVKALQLVPFLIAFPVSTGDRHQLKSSDRFWAGDVRTAAEVEELPLLIERNGFVVAKSHFDMFDFEFLVHVLADLERLVTRLNDPFERFIQRDEFFHFRFDGRKVVFGQRLLHHKVVIESRIGGRTERELDPFFDSHHRASHDVCAAVPHGAECIGAFFGDDFEFDFFAIDHVIESNRLQIDFAPHGIFGQARTDTFGDIFDRDRAIKFFDAAIGEFYRGH